MPKLHFLPFRSTCTSSQCFHHILSFGLHFYAFLPFSIILKTLRKIRENKATGILVVPLWPTQSWWPYLTSMLIAQPITLPRTSKLLYLPTEPERIHTLSRTMNLLFFQVSGDYSIVEIFHTQLQTSLSNPGLM